MIEKRAIRSTPREVEQLEKINAEGREFVGAREMLLRPMTLHAAIQQVLREAGRPLNSRDIADIVNQRKLYRRKDNALVPAGQISARVRNYPDRFVRTDAGIWLA